MKFIISFITMLLIVANSVLLLSQYHVYSSSLDEKEASYFYEQEVELKFKEDKIIVKQHFNNLPQGEIAVVWPISSENRSCDLSKSTNCDRLTEDLTSFKEGESLSESISYEIPFKDGLKDGQILSDFLVKLEKGGVSYTTLHITDELKRGGMWVSGLPVLGSTSLDLIDYSLFEGEGDLRDLYWQKEVLPVQYEANYYSLYSHNEIPKELIVQLEELHLPNREHVSVLFTNKKNDMNDSRIIFIENEDIASIQRELIVKQVQLRYGIDSADPLLAEVISSFLLDRPIGTEKANWMYDTLVNYLTTEQLESWKAEFEKKNQMDAEKLDALLSNILHLKTSFFALNVQAGAEHFPLLFEDSRPVYINELQQENMKVLFKEGKVLYAVEPLLSVLGYSINDTDKGLYVQNATRAFRFPIHEPFYVLNQKRYDAMSEPFEKIGSVYYIEEAWMIRLFLLDVEKEDKRINIIQS
ncbi:hypothetical protein WAX74_16240 [Psychrobacillus sp. FJAT-51614]|uniref:RNA polymerase II n=1 Tax=Psychrobacillus mangrovi TaxID=3117745 RepID=A0ABU8F8S8_9BACI